MLQYRYSILLVWLGEDLLHYPVTTSSITTVTGKTRRINWNNNGIFYSEKIGIIFHQIRTLYNEQPYRQ